MLTKPGRSVIIVGDTSAEWSLPISCHQFVFANHDWIYYVIKKLSQSRTTIDNVV